MTPPIEILVHASAPSRGADDVRYRREALGFLQFDTAQVHTLLGHGPHTSGQTHSHFVTSETSEDRPQRQVIVPEAKTSSAAEKAAPDSTVPNRPNRLPAWRTPRYTRPTASTLPWTATKHTPHLLIERTPALPRPRTAPTQSTPAQAPPFRRSQSDSWHTPPSVIPDSQPTPPSSGPPAISSSPYLKRPFASSSPSPTRHASPPAAKRPRLQVPSSPPSEDPLIHAPSLPTPALISSPPTAKRPRLEVPSSPPPANPALQQSRSPAAAPTSSPRAEHPPASSTTLTRTPQTLEIHPRRPKTSKGAFRTHLTHSLTTIASIPPLATRFKPATTTRPLHALERGHWLVPIGSWDDALKRRFWKFLTEFVGGGQAGWGTWCVWETEGPSCNRDGDEGNRVVGAEEVVKVYCWGEVVGEVWILLYIGSDKKVRDVEAKWVDAGGVAVVVMR
ncbi:hypothetical protein IMSHALPRED_004753 [Imshaugia aleurites]|uniref:Uncharacterized protein n=1 Tax=Imshaugia aleurites TaxID=172621 RepID=A0A8H3ILM6_9LECA|nr:hypothetical protein IMSHALPRED_004753 [Imshaugia aleurites]